MDILGFRKSPQAQRGSNFYPVFWFLPREGREALEAVYAFCREVDDLADELAPGAGPGHPDWQSAARDLTTWREEIARLYDGRPAHPLARRLLPFVERFHLPREAFLGVLEGVERDLSVERYPTFADLEPYLRGVASSVGLLCLPIFGARSEAAREYARLLGYALQMTNILRDVGSDLDRGRIYLPLEDLALFKVAEADLQARLYSPQFIELMRFEHRRALALYEAAKSRLNGDRALLPAELMSSIYEALLEKLRRTNFDVLGRPIRLTPAEKLAAVAKRHSAFRKASASGRAAAG